MAAGDDAKRKAIREKAERILALDPAAALGVTRTATNEEVTRAFTMAAKTWHPDRVPAGLEDLAPLFSQVFARLDEARRALADAKTGRPAPAGSPQAKAAVAAAAASSEASTEHKKAEVLFKKNDLAGAEKHLRRALELAPSNVDYQAMLFWVEASKPTCTKPRLAELVAELTKLVTRSDQCANAWFYRGMLKKRLDRGEEAASDFARAAKLDPQNVDAVREVRLHEMRKQKRSDPPPSSPGFFGKLFKR
jgi:tetratricopeptide (TPR) repeat protein